MLSLNDLELSIRRGEAAVMIGGVERAVRVITMAEAEEIEAVIPDGPGANIDRNCLHAALALGVDAAEWDTEGLGLKPLPPDARQKESPAGRRLRYARAVVPRLKALLTPAEIIAVCEARPGKDERSGSSTAAAAGPGPGTPSASSRSSR
jgi:hypothetical protein